MSDGDRKTADGSQPKPDEARQRRKAMQDTFGRDLPPLPLKPPID